MKDSETKTYSGKKVHYKLNLRILNTLLLRFKHSKFGIAVSPLAGISYFVLILIVSHFFWKFTVLGSETDQFVTFFGMDISAPFVAMARHVAIVTSELLNFLNFPIELTANNVIRHDNNVAVMVVWSCTGLKQAYIFTCIILFYRGSFKKKIWYIPLGLVIIYAFNIFRITAITGLIKANPNWFYLLHEHAFKYMFYAVIFGLWVVWEERISRKAIQK